MKKHLLLLVAILLSMTNFSQTTGLVYEFSFDNTLQCNNQSSVAFYYPNPSYANDRTDLSSSALTLSHGANVQLPLLPQGNAARSVSVWVKFTGLYNYSEHYIWGYGSPSNNSAYGLLVVNNGTIKNYGWGNDNTGTTSIQPNEWYNFVTTFDGTIANTYVNGVRIASGNFSSWNTAGTYLNIGRSISAETGAASIIDELKIYDIALDSTQIMNLYTTAIDTAGILNSLVSYYDFENKLTNHSNQLELTNNNNVQFSTSSYSGSGVVFNEANSLTSTEYSSLIPTTVGESFTVSFYKKDAASPSKSYPTFIELFGSYYHRYESSRKYQFGYASTVSNWNGVNTGSPILDTQNWKNITLVHNGTSGKDRLYYDGEILMELTNSSAAVYAFNNVLAIGSGTNANGTLHNDKYYKGELDELYIFNKALTVAELKFVKEGRLEIPESVATAQTNAEKSKISFYPNPIRNFINFNDESNTNKSIVNLNGTVLMQTTQNSIDVTNLPSGIYLIKFTIDNQTYTYEKFVKQ